VDGNILPERISVASTVGTLHRLGNCLLESSAPFGYTAASLLIFP